MIHIYYGYGKGKTSAALGLALRACGAGKKVDFFSFLKDNSSSERFVKCDINFFKNPDEVKFLFNMSEEEKKEYCDFLFSTVENAFNSDADIIVLDEFLDVISLLGKKYVEEISFSPDKEYVITGHIKNDFLFDKADYITEMRKEKHPFDSGVAARRGIEY